MYKKVKYYKIILIFMSSCFVTVILHFKDNFYHNLLYLFTYLLCFFVFYGMHAEKNIIEKEKEMMTLFKIIFLLTSLISFIGLIVTILKIQVKVFDYYWLGIYENRLIGIYTNSNLLALFCVISSIGVHIITASDSFKLDKRKKTLKIVYIIGTTINIISLILSDSNGSFIFFLIYFVVILFYYLFRKYSELTFKIIIKNAFIILSAGLILTAASFYIRGVCQNSIAVLINSIHIKEPVHDNKVPANKEANNSIIDTVEIGRILGNNDYDGSSGRVTLIKQAVVMFKKNPIMGIGIANIPKYGEKYIKGGLKFPNFHNGYITILVAWGIVGFFIFTIYSLLVAAKFCDILFKINDSQNTPFPKLFAFLVSYCVYSLVEITILSDITFTIFIFWTILGYATSYLNNYNSNIIYNSKLS